MKIAIHQPNFFPHAPFFEKMAKADLFIVMSHCQFEKNNYQNRFEYRGWHTMSVSKKIEPINHKEYLNPEKDWMKIKCQLKDIDLNEFNKYINKSLYLTNIGIIFHLRNRLKIKTSIMCDYQTELKGTERLVDICKKFGANTYISGSSGSSYMDIELFKKSGIKVEFQKKTKTKPIIMVI